MTAWPPRHGRAGAQRPAQRAPSGARSSVPAVLALLCAFVVAPEARAGDDDPPSAWLKLDRVVTEPSYFEDMARLRVYVSAVRLQGGIIPISGEGAWTLKVGASKKRLPYLAGTFAGTGEPLALALVVQLSSDFAQTLPLIRETAAAFLDTLPGDPQLTVVGYGENVQGGTRLGSRSRARSDLEDLEAEDLPEEPRLVKAVDRAITTLGRAENAHGGDELRRAIVVIGDGRDSAPDPDNYRQIAERAADKRIRIHTLAYSPEDIRRPMLGLGEMSKVSHGTLRWVRTKTVPGPQGDEVADLDAQRQAFETQLGTLTDEVLRQFVLTWFTGADRIANRSVSVAWGDLESNTIRAGPVACGGQACADGEYCVAGRCVARNRDPGRGFFGWLLLVGGILVGGLLVLVAIGFVITRVSERRAADAALARAAAEAQAPPQAPSHRIVPQGPQGGRVPPAGGAAQAGPGAPTGGPVQPAGGGPVPPAAGAVQPMQPGGGGAPRPAAVRPSLLIMSGPLQGQRLPLRHGFTVGKAPGCDLVLAQDGFASSQHAQVLMDTGGGCTLVDKNSTNGTFVNGVRAQQMRLQHGMSIRIGSTEMRFLLQ